MGKEIPRSFERIRSGEHIQIMTFTNVAAATAVGVTAAKFPRRIIHLSAGAQGVWLAWLFRMGRIGNKSPLARMPSDYARTSPHHSPDSAAVVAGGGSAGLRTRAASGEKELKPGGLAWGGSASSRAERTCGPYPCPFTNQVSC